MASQKRVRGKHRLEDLVALQAHLRSPQGCPWDREQTHETLRTYLLEETYEVLEAIEQGDSDKLAAELGDLLLQIVFHSQLAHEEGRFTIDDVVERIYTKLVRRHPHVFGPSTPLGASAAKPENSKQVLKNWETLKAEERQGLQPAPSTRRDGRRAGTAGAGQAEDSGKPQSILEGVPRTLPALLEAWQLTRRASNIGFDWDDIEGLLAKLKEETAELRQTLAANDSRRLEEEVGDLLFVAVNVARFLGVDPEIALKKANRKFTARFQQMEQEMARQARRLADASKEEMEALWERSKNRA